MKTTRVQRKPSPFPAAIVLMALTTAPASAGGNPRQSEYNHVYAVAMNALAAEFCESDGVALLRSDPARFRLRLRNRTEAQSIVSDAASIARDLPIASPTGLTQTLPKACSSVMFYVYPFQPSWGGEEVSVEVSGDLLEVDRCPEKAIWRIRFYANFFSYGAHYGLYSSVCIVAETSNLSDVSGLKAFPRIPSIRAMLAHPLDF